MRKFSRASGIKRKKRSGNIRKPQCRYTNVWIFSSSLPPPPPPLPPPSLFSMAPSNAAGSQLNHRGGDALSYLSTLRSLDSQIPGSSSPQLSSQSEPPDVRNWFSSYEYESPTEESSLLGLELENCAHEEVDGGGGVKIDLEKPVVKASGEEEDCTAIAEENIVGLAGADHEGENISPRSTWNEIGREKSSECSFVHFNNHRSFLPKFEEWQIPNNYDEERNLFAPRFNRYSVENFKRNKQNQEELSNRNDTNTMISSKLSSGVGCFVPDDGLFSRSDYGQEKSVRSVSELVDDKENSKESNSRWISTRKPRDCSGTERGSRKAIPVLKHKEAESTSKVYIVSRKRDALADQTNLVPGKWHCPSKRKPSLRPPLKQLRLERWVRRAT